MHGLGAIGRYDRAMIIYSSEICLYMMVVCAVFVCLLFALRVWGRFGHALVIEYLNEKRL